MKKFWMLFVEGQSSPTRKHESYLDALQEARRIADASNFKGARIYVLEATGVMAVQRTVELVHKEIKYD